jgi:hypothetical protein
MSGFEQFRTSDKNDGDNETHIPEALEGRLIPQEEIDELDKPEQAYAYIINIREILDAKGRLPRSASTDLKRLQEGEHDGGLLFTGFKVDYDDSRNPYLSESFFYLRTEFAGNSYGRQEVVPWPKEAPRGFIGLGEKVYREDGRVEREFDFNGTDLEEMDPAYQERVFTEPFIERLQQIAEQLQSDLEPEEE